MSENELKIILLGAAATGKTALAQRFITGEFIKKYKLEVGMNITTKEIEYKKGKRVTLGVWDTPMGERFRFMRQTLFKGADGALILCDLTRNKTFQIMEEWINSLKAESGKVPFIIVGNKIDLIEETGEVVDRKEAQSYAKEHGGFYMETSAKTGKNVEEVFLKLTELILD
ncbi:MAG: Rab family GTPase [Promethearchaeia archaeon]